MDKVQFGEDVDIDTRQPFERLLHEYSETFSRDDSDIGHTTTVTHKINLTDETPVHKPPYRVPYSARPLMESTIQNLVETGAIRESQSSFGSPVFFVDKDGGKGKRLVAEYRALNAKTIPDRTPMPHPEDIFGTLSGKTVFCKLDITAMFNQIEVDPEDVHKTAVTTPFGLYEFKAMPFGLINAPATAVRLMRTVLHGLTDKICYVYFDDIIVFAADIRELADNCRAVLERLKQHNLKLKPSKCIFACKEVKFLGHMITADGIKMDPKHIESVLKFPVPNTASKVRSFLGLCNYNRRFIRGYADIARPLTPLTTKDKDLVWSSEAQTAFDTQGGADISAGPQTL